MKRILALVLLAAFFIITAPADAAEKTPGFVKGGFEMAGFLDAGFGWQRFSNDPVTEWANDGSFAGVLGSVISNVATGVPPDPGQDDTEAFLEVAELDIMKVFGERATLRADIWFGRPTSGSWVWAGVEIEQAYLTVTLWKEHALDLTIGRFGTQAGFEPYEPFNLDTISWSILARSDLYPYFITGLQLSAEFTDHLSISVAAANDILSDTNLGVEDVPGALASFVVSWGREDQENSFILTPFFGPSSGENRHFSYGANATLIVWPMEALQLGLEGLYHRDNGNGGPNTDYAAGLLNLHWDMTESWYGVLKYAYAQQFNIGNGVYSLTGAEQQIHEISLGAGHSIADGLKLKLESRFDIVRPSGGDTQTVPGAALELACAF